MIDRLIVVNVALIAVYMTLWFLLAKKRDRLNTVDVAWGSAFAVVALAVLAQHPRQPSILLATLVVVWALRLTNHLYERVIVGGKEDPRYEEIRSKWKGNVWLRAYFSIFLLQGLLVFVISLPVTMAANSPNENLVWLSLAGVALWLIGFGFEMVADKQLRDFVHQPENKGKVMQQGLWRYSRHPNYFGELTQWWAIGVIALQASYGWVGLLGPLTLTILILFVSGIPMIENRKKHNPAYADYMKRTSKLLPLPPKS